MFDLVVHSSRLLGNFSAVLGLEVLGIFENLFCRSVPHQNLEGLILLRLSLKGIGTVLLPKFLYEFRLFLETNPNSTRHGGSTDDHLRNPDRLQSSLVSNNIWVDPSTCDTISQGIVSILKLLTKNFLVQNPQSDRLEETFTVQLEGATKVKVIGKRKVDTMSNHLRTKNTRIKLRIVC